jgi:predicted Na+-dependent transporter
MDTLLMILLFVSGLLIGVMLGREYERKIFLSNMSNALKVMAVGMKNLASAAAMAPEQKKEEEKK